MIAATCCAVVYSIVCSFVAVEEVDEDEDMGSVSAAGLGPQLNDLQASENGQEVSETMVTKTNIAALGALLRSRGDGFNANNPQLAVSAGT